MIASTITQKIAEALIKHDEVRLSTLRLLSSALNYEKIAKQHELSEEEELIVVRQEAKKRKESIEAYNRFNAKDRAQRESQELGILEEFLPRELSNKEIEKLVGKAINKTDAKEISDMGKIIGMVVGEAKGRADGVKVAQIVKSKLGK